MKILIAIFLTLILLAISFVYPIFFHWYRINYLKDIDDTLPVMTSFYMLIGLFVSLIFYWIKAINDKN